ncbi:transcription factor bHLH121 isoform X1 [Lactuca sativa]|uniref:BHLH domain-containing protein n=1 Tax=Lactuca sativa TaxID=4236 RepID=A0A9R1VVS1_LACSA|nr:transcription factor bHLH121 isoform X1 [Lactuca sativa]KAJ0213496.1 hypothetical protein LSAT_V11C400213430 [Lactuca sativa]
MDQWNAKLELHQQQYQHISNSHSDQRETAEVEVKDTSDARKVQKADREKLRRDKLNEQFIELGHLLDPDRPKNDKSSIIIDTIQILKDLTNEVNRLKAECSALSEESCELIQEKNELREEKSSLKSDIENLNTQYQQRVGVMYPWGGIDPSSVVMPPPFSYPVALPVPAGPLPIHPFPFYANHNPPGASIMPYPNPNPANYHINNQTLPVYVSRSSKQESGNKSSEQFRGSNSNDEKGDNSSDVVTDLELKTPGSQGEKKSKQLERRDGVCSSSRYTSSQGFQDSSSNNGESNDL